MTYPYETATEEQRKGDLEADLEVTVGRTIAHPTRSGATVDVDVEKDVPMCVECYKWAYEIGEIPGSRSQSSIASQPEPPLCP